MLTRFETKPTVPVLMGISGTGKSTTMKLMTNANLPLYGIYQYSKLQRSVSGTTRDIRLNDNEVDGIHYNFNPEETTRLYEQGKWIAKAIVPKSKEPSDGFNYYIHDDIQWRQALAQGMLPLFDVNATSLKEFKERAAARNLRPYVILLQPEGIETFEDIDNYKVDEFVWERIGKSRKDSPEKVAGRIDFARRELGEIISMLDEIDQTIFVKANWPTPKVVAEAALNGLASKILGQSQITQFESSIDLSRSGFMQNQNAREAMMSIALGS